MLRLGMYRISDRHLSGLGLACFATPLGMFCRLMGYFGGLCLPFMKEKKYEFLLCVCFNKHEKSIQGVIFIFIFRFVSFLLRLCMGLPSSFLLLVFRFSSWFVASVWLFYIYGGG